MYLSEKFHQSDVMSEKISQIRCNVSEKFTDSNILFQELCFLRNVPIKMNVSEFFYISNELF